ncbi:hypothetical protein cypCar_00025596 [Cyprinus carpio]|nr:hypothetical protein cypCar_00025596 [Cyprinus carpio]
MAVRSPFFPLLLMLLGLVLDRASTHAFNPSRLQQHKVLHLDPNMDFLSFFPLLTGRRTVAWLISNQTQWNVLCRATKRDPTPGHGKSHCRGKAEDASSWRIVLGKHQLKRAESAERIFPVKRIYRHEHFRYPAHSELDYDIALVKAATDIQTSNFIRYACLPRKQINLKPGHYCWVTGWGDTRGGKENVSLAEALNQARLPIIDYKTCRQKKFWGDRVRDSMICAGFRDTEGTPAACQGDSGGPLLCQEGRDRWEVHGIVSFGPIGCTVENKPSVFTRTAAYIPWIEATRIRDFFLH